MRKCLGGYVLITVLLNFTASAADLRLFFSTQDPVGGGHPALPIIVAPGPLNVAAAAGNSLLTPPELSSGQNPVVTEEGTQLHLWATGTLGDSDPHIWNGIGIRIEIDGPATLSFGGGLNVISPTTFRRWESGSDFNPMADFPSGAPANFNFVAVTRQGLSLPPLNDGWDNGENAVYLGYLNFDSNAGRSEIRLAVDNSGISRQGGDVENDQVYFGFGDEPLRGNDFGQSSRLADAIILPEPTSIGLALIVTMSIVRRRRSHASYLLEQTS